MARCGWCGGLIPATSALSVIARRRRDKPATRPSALRTINLPCLAPQHTLLGSLRPACQLLSSMVPELD